MPRQRHGGCYCSVSCEEPEWDRSAKGPRRNKLANCASGWPGSSEASPRYSRYCGLTSFDPRHPHPELGTTEADNLDSLRDSVGPFHAPHAATDALSTGDEDRVDWERARGPGIDGRELTAAYSRPGSAIALANARYRLRVFQVIQKR